MDSIFVRAPYSGLSMWVELFDISQGLSNVSNNLKFKKKKKQRNYVTNNNKTRECSHLINISTREPFVKRRPQGFLDKCASDR